MLLKIVLWAFLFGSLILGYFGMQAAGVTTTLIGIGVLFVIVFLIYFLFQLGFEAFLVFLKFFGIALIVGVLILLTIRGCNMVIAKGRQATQAVVEKTTEMKDKIKQASHSDTTQTVSTSSGSWYSNIKSFVTGHSKTDVLPPPEKVQTVSQINDTPKQIQGIVRRVYAGNIFQLGSTYLKLYGIDVPNLKQTCIDKRGENYKCGLLAKQRLEKLLINKKLTCQIVSSYSQNQYLVTCAIQGYDVGATMVAVGWALADRTATDVYIPYENEARTKKLGLWAGKFVAPWTYRQKVVGEANSSKKGFFEGLFK